MLQIYIFIKNTTNDKVFKKNNWKFFLLNTLIPKWRLFSFEWSFSFGLFFICKKKRPNERYVNLIYRILINQKCLCTRQWSLSNNKCIEKYSGVQKSYTEGIGNYFTMQRQPDKYKYKQNEVIVKKLSLRFLYCTLIPN